MSHPSPHIDDGRWHSPLTIDLLHKVLKTTFLHPFVAWVIPLCLRAQATPFTHMAMIITISYAVLLTLLYVLSIINQRIAYGKPRDVDLSEEVIVVTGGASGLGLLIAEVYGLRGASVAVLDVRELEVGEARGVEFYRCDVGNREEVERVAKEIEEDVRLPIHHMNTITNSYPQLRPAWDTYNPDQQRCHSPWEISPGPHP
jgi:short chain dehydrogenase